MLYNNLNFECIKFASSFRMKPELAGVLFKKDKTVATDTFRLMEVTVDGSVKVDDFPKVGGVIPMRGFEPFIVNSTALKEVVKMKRGSKTLPILEYVAVSHVDKDNVEFIATDLETQGKQQCRRVDGKFPDYEKMFNDDKPVVEFKVNGKLMAEILETMARVKNDKEVIIKIYGKETAMRFEADNGNQKARALLMLLRDI